MSTQLVGQHLKISPVLKGYQNIAAELRIPPKAIITGLVIAGLILALLSDIWSDQDRQIQVQLFSLSLYIMAAAVWLLASWRPELGRWFTIILTLAIISLGLHWLEIPEILLLMIIPTALAVILISLPAAALTAVAATMLVLLLPRYLALEIHPASTVIILMGIWGIFGVMLAVYHSIYQNIAPLWEHFQHAQYALEEARDRKAELEQALDNLAHANREQALLNERLAAMRLVAEEAQKTKAAFVAKVSHEFRTPLNMIIGLTDLLVAKPEVYGEQLSPALLEDLNIVHRNCEHLSHMINDLLELSRTEMGYLTLHREWVNLAECVESSLAVVRPLLEQKKLDLRLVIPDDLPQVYCDQTRIRQVILNLVNNAARFTERGRITVQATPQDHHIVVSVADTGPGIAPKDAEIIFEPFHQGTSNLWRDQGGSGLGLSICKQFVELHNGEIWLESEPGLGSSFFFKLPISPPASPTARPGRWINENWARFERVTKSKVQQLPLKQRILICDETGDLCAALAHYSDEIEFIDTRNLAQAEQELQQKTADLVVLNADPPAKLWPLVEQAKAGIADIPIIACSFPPQINWASKAGISNYLVKPVTRSELIQAIQAVDRPVRKILIVDDDPEVQLLLTRMLTTEEDSFEISVVSGGRQALQELRGQMPDLMLLDIAMPDIDGWQTLELKNQDETISHIPVIVISAQEAGNQTLTSQFSWAAIEPGLSASKFLRCSLELSALMLQPD